jgi:protein TonB
MMDAARFSDLLAYSAQVACIAAVGGLLSALVRIDASGVRYAYFRALLALCLALPWIQTRQDPGDAGAAVTFASTVVGLSVAPNAVRARADFPWMTALSALLICGVAVRVLWIAVGLVRLRRLRFSGQASPTSPEQEELQHLLGTQADIRYVTGLSQPVTFGLRRPIVLLPDALRSHAPHVQRAVLSHELIHVQRRDWAWLLAEEAVRAVLWFHPGVWWLVSRVQLAREEAVDQLAVLATGARRAYIEALAAFADETPLVPVAAFARRRHLFRRMTLISKEAGMSSRRIVVSCAVMAVVVAAGSWFAVGAFPLREAPAQGIRNEIGPLEKQAMPITPENPLPRRTYSVDPQYPGEAAAVDANAMVTLMITLDQSGRVAEVRRLGVAPIAPPTAPPQSDPQMVAALNALVASAADAVRQWQYDPPAEPPISIRVTFAFSPSIAPRLVAHNGWSLTEPGVVGGRGGGPQLVGAAPPPPPPPPPPSTTQDRPSWASDAIRIGGAILAPTKVKHVNPVYPAVAQSARVQGVVIIEARIGPDGRVSNARVLRSIPLLDQAALDAVMQWEFTPTRLNGQPVPVIMTMTVQFTLT